MSVILSKFYVIILHLSIEKTESSNSLTLLKGNSLAFEVLNSLY